MDNSKLKNIIRTILIEYVQVNLMLHRKYSKDYCLKTPCNKMGFSQKASCRPYKNCYKNK